MNIGIMARGLSEKAGGVKEYIKCITENLIDMDKENNYFIFYNKKQHLGTFLKGKEIVLKSGSKLIWDYVYIPLAIRKYNIDILFCPKNVVPFFIGCKSIVVVHDLAHFYPSLNAYKFLENFYMCLMIKSSVKRANYIIAVSQNTKKDIIKFTEVDPQKILVIYEAPDKRYKIIKNKKMLDIIRKKYNLYFPFMFYSGSLSPRKNPIRLVKAFNQIKDKIPHNLVLTGGKSWKDKGVYRLIKDLKLDGRVVKLGFVPDQEMPMLYNLADLFVYPSLYEGFGLPPLEAMACGCPVIASNLASCHEVAGKGAMVVDPYSVEEISSGILKILNDRVYRKILIKKGFSNLLKFSWKKTTNQLLLSINNLRL